MKKSLIAGAIVAALLAGCSAETDSLKPASVPASVSPVPAIEAPESTTAQEVAQETAKPTNTEKNVPREYTAALKKAEMYAESMSMSKAAIYDQLTSEYGEKFTKEEAQYAIDHLEK